ncbi:transketolase [Holdemania filiformis]
MKEMNQTEMKKIAAEVRKNIIRMTCAAQSGHPGGSLSAVEILVSLYFNEMNITEENVDDVCRDKFVLSKGHASPVLYSVLKEKGFISQEDLMTFRKINSHIQGHPNMSIKGVDMSTGSLGQGLSSAVGMAMSYKIHHQDFRVYALVGDGESEEGQIWEAAMAAAHYKLDNLVAILDFNGLQIDGKITDVMNPTPFDTKFRAFGWNVVEVDGHDYDQLENAYAAARECKGQPTLILAHTVKGKGVSFMENKENWHGVAPKPEEAEAAIQELEAQING